MLPEGATAIHAIFYGAGSNEDFPLLAQFFDQLPPLPPENYCGETNDAEGKGSRLIWLNHVSSCCIGIVANARRTCIEKGQICKGGKGRKQPLRTRKTALQNAVSRCSRLFLAILALDTWKAAFSGRPRAFPFVAVCSC